MYFVPDSVLGIGGKAGEAILRSGHCSLCSFTWEDLPSSFTNSWQLIFFFLIQRNNGKPLSPGPSHVYVCGSSEWASGAVAQSSEESYTPGISPWSLTHRSLSGAFWREWGHDPFLPLPAADKGQCHKVLKVLCKQKCYVVRVIIVTPHCQSLLSQGFGTVFTHIWFILQNIAFI